MISPPALSVILEGAAEAIALIVIGSGLIQAVLQIWQLLLAARALRAMPPEPASALIWSRYAASAPAIALLVPAYNEEATIETSLRSLLALHYPRFEIVVVNDGSKDGTMAALKRAFELEPIERDYDVVAPCQPIIGLYTSPAQPRLIVVDKVNGGKADALNAAINLSRAPVLCSMDADSLLEPDALIRAVQPFVDDPERVIAVGGSIRTVNNCKVQGGRVTQIRLSRNPLVLFQTVEYLRAFLMARLAWSRAESLTIISGAFGLFRRATVVEVGGYSLGTVGEDMELVVKLHRRMHDTGRDYRIAFVPEPVCWTEVPESLAVLGRQRARWHRGAMETFFKHRDMLFNPKYGRVGWIGFGYILLVDVLGPFIEIVGLVLVPLLWAMGLLSVDYLLAFIAVSFAFGVVISVGALALEEEELHRYPRTHELLTLGVAAVLENFGYRQLNTYWRLKGFHQWITGSHAWGEMTRKGFATA
jgi:cellulose synthase/poly-beta-1,6-N-acetylglucosamine synthase-like glycosyltransferase